MKLVEIVALHFVNAPFSFRDLHKIIDPKNMDHFLLRVPLIQRSRNYSLDIRS